MNLRQWARATQKAMANQPPEFRQQDFSMAEVEMILRQSIHVLTETLIRGDDLRLRDLGRLWIKQKPPRLVISNLPGQEKQYDLQQRKTLRFQASAKLTTIILSDQSTRNTHASEKP